MLRSPAKVIDMLRFVSLEKSERASVRERRRSIKLEGKDTVRREEIEILK